MSNITGTDEIDVLEGTDQADVINAGAGNDTIRAGAGNDVIDAGRGADIIDAGAGDDTIKVTLDDVYATSLSDIFDTTQYFVRQYATEVLLVDAIDGGLGTDVLELDLGAGTNLYYTQTSVYLSAQNIQNVESIRMVADNSAHYGQFIIDQAVWSQVADLKLGTNSFRLTVLGDGGSFSAVALSESNLSDTHFVGAFNSIDLSLPQSLNVSKIAGRFNQLIGSDGSDDIILDSITGTSTDLAFNNNLAIGLGQGNDSLEFSNNISGTLTGYLDAGDGVDLVKFSSTGLIDLTQVTLQGIESISINGVLIVNEGDLSGITLSGSGSVFIKGTDGYLYGTDGEDVFSGSESEVIVGGLGNDVISNVKAAYFNGAQSEYTVTRGADSLVQVEHSGGVMSDGIDTLNNVRQLIFADDPNNPLILDDFHNLKTSVLTEMKTDQLINGRFDTSTDLDYFDLYMEPGQPFVINGGAENDGKIVYQFFDAEGTQLKIYMVPDGVYPDGNYVNQTYSFWPNNTHLLGYSSHNGFEVHKGGLVTARIQPFEVHTGTDYSISFDTQDDYTDTLSTRGEIDANTGSIFGYIAKQGDVDFIRTELVAGTTYIFEAKGQASAGGTLLDPKLELYKAENLADPISSVVVAGAAGADEKFQVTVDATGTYILAISDASGLYDGSYTITQVSKDLQSADIATTGRLTFNDQGFAEISSEINALADRDWFSIDLSEGQAYTIEALGSSSTNGTLSAPLIEIRTAAGTLLSSNSGGGTIGNDAKILFQSPEDATYFVSIAAAGNSSIGTYTIKVGGIADDYAGSSLTTGLITPDGSATYGLINTQDDTDWLKVGLSADQAYKIALSGDTRNDAVLDPLNDTYLTVRDANGQIVRFNDDANGSSSSELFFTPSETGIYFIEAKSAVGLLTGGYQLSVTPAEADDHVNSLSEATPTSLALGTPASGAIQIPGDVDVFAVDMVAGTVYRLDAQGLASTEGTLTDPVIRVFNSAGELVQVADNGGLGLESKAYFVPTQNDTYYVEVSSGIQANLGTYKLSVVDTPLPSDDAGDTVATARLVQTGDNNDGNLLIRGDEDWFAVDLQAGSRYVAIMKGKATGGGSLDDPYLELRDSSGSFLTSNDDGSWQKDAGISYEITSTGRYYFVAKTLDTDATGTYSFTVRDPDDHGSTKASATTVVLDTPVDGGIQWADGRFGAKAVNTDATPVDRDEDWFQIDLTLDQIVTFKVTPTENDGLGRAMLEVLDPLGVPVGRGDGLTVTDGTASVAVKAASAGTYQVRVIDGAGYTGNYQFAVVSGDIADEDASSPMALTFTSGEASYDGVIGLAADTDTYTVDLASDISYRIQLGKVTDGVVAALENGTMSVVFTPTDGSAVETLDTSANSGELAGGIQLTYAASKSGTLTIEVAATGDLDQGQYQLKVIDLAVNQVDEAPDTITDAAVDGVDLTVGDAVNGALHARSDTDLYTVQASAGQRFVAKLKGYDAGEGTLADTSLYLLTSTGTLVASSVNASDFGQLDVTLLDAGTYYLQVGGNGSAGAVGTYLLETSSAAADASSDSVAANALTNATVAPGAEFASSIDFVGDRDWVKADLEAGVNYVIDLQGVGAGQGTLANGHLQVFTASGVMLMQNADSGAGDDARIRLNGGDGETVYISVAGEDTSTGTYELRVREMYTGDYDPLVDQQWYLDSLNVTAVSDEYSGAGVVVGVVDDGVEYHHPDLINQVNLLQDRDSQFGTDSGEHKNVLPPDAHGTPVMGIINAEANNETGVVGIAPDADGVSYRVKWAHSHISDALSYQHLVDVSNNSWGAIDPFWDNFSSNSHLIDYASIRYAAEAGRENLGTVFVFSAGNDRAAGENVNYHNFQNARETLTVAAVDSNDIIENFSTPGAAILTSAYGSNVLTTDRLGFDGYSTGDYTQFSGTSAAAPQVSAIVALMLEANADLGYRDVQEIVAHASRHPGSADWKINASTDHNLGGMHFNDDMGFGIIDAHAAVRLAETWQTQHTAYNEAYVGVRELGTNDVIPDGIDGASLASTFTINTNIDVEHVELSVDIRHGRMGDLEIDLISPNGTVSRIFDRPTVTEDRPYGLYGEYSDTPSHLVFDLSSVQFYGEDSIGDWQVVIRDVRAEFEGKVYGLSLRVYGADDGEDDQFIFTNEFGDINEPISLRDDGGVDWLNASAVTSNSTIDLAAGTMTIDGRNATIESWVDIENIATGDGNDLLIGNSLVNHLIAGRGNDTVTASRGSDTIEAGDGVDTVIFDGNKGDYALAFNTEDRSVTVSRSYNDNGTTVSETDILTGVESLQFADQTYSLSSDLGNAAPTVGLDILATAMLVSDDGNFELVIPSSAFADDSGTLTLSAELHGGQNLPDWMSFDPVTGALAGEPPSGESGRYEVIIRAEDEFGETVEQTLTIEVGDNRAPIIDSAKTLEIEEDTALTSLSLNAPTDPENDSFVIEVTGIPSSGEIVNGSTSAVIVVGDTLTANELTDLVYRATADFAGSAGDFSYTVMDARGVASDSSVSFLLTAINDSPVFGADGYENVVYTSGTLVQTLSLITPTDAEDVLSLVVIEGLPTDGWILLADNSIAVVGDTIALTDLASIKFAIDHAVQGPVGELTLSATDAAGAKTVWHTGISVNGEAGVNMGSSSADQIYGSSAADSVFGLGGDDIIVTNDGDDTVYAGSGNDTVLAGLGNDNIDGGGGDDYLDGGYGADLLKGGPGDDRYVVDNTSDLVVEALARGGFDTVETYIDFTAPQYVEAIEARGSADLILTGNTENNVIIGNVGNNFLYGHDGSDALVAGDGNDTLDGGLGRDHMIGGTGNDVYVVDSRSDVVVEELGNGVDLVKSSATFTLSSHVENLVLTGTDNISGGGNSLNNSITGNAGNNLLNGGIGADTLDGGDGNDTYVVDNIGDVIIDSAGVDTIRSTLDYILADGIEDLVLLGLNRIDGQGNDVDNALTGNSSDNVLDGHAGTDILTGGRGDDNFVASDHAQSVDSITDFVSGEDMILIDALAYDLFDTTTLTGYTQGTVETSSFGTITNGVQDNVEALFVYDSDRNMLTVDADGSGAGVAIDVFDFSGTSDHPLSSDLYVLL
jgi:Ca2+-binding RTX toxin-like protein/subtilisin-like proprotein convertase family protein